MCVCAHMPICTDTCACFYVPTFGDAARSSSRTWDAACPSGFMLRRTLDANRRAKTCRPMGCGSPRLMKFMKSAGVPQSRGNAGKWMCIPPRYGRIDTFWFVAVRTDLSSSGELAIMPPMFISWLSCNTEKLWTYFDRGDTTPWPKNCRKKSGLVWRENGPISRWKCTQNPTVSHSCPDSKCIELSLLWR